MFRIAALFLFLLFVPSAGLSLTPEQLFLLYAHTVPANTVAQRLQQLFVNLPPGAFKDQARTTLMDDLRSQLQTQLDTYQASYIDPVAENLSDVNDTTLP